MTEKDDKKRPKLNASTVHALQLMDKGVDVHDAHKLATGIDKPHRNSILDLKKKYAAFLLTKRSTVKLASKVFVETMKMTPTETDEVKACPECRGKKDDEGSPSPCVTCGSTGIVKTLLYPSHTNRLAAAKEVMDRVDPIVTQSVNLNVDQTFIDVTVEQF